MLVNMSQNLQNFNRIGIPYTIETAERRLRRAGKWVFTVQYVFATPFENPTLSAFATPSQQFLLHGDHTSSLPCEFP